MKSILSSADTQLHSGRPFWPGRSKQASIWPPLGSDIDCEVAVIGGGITGALLAYRLARTGLSVVLADKHTFGSGSTSASTALVGYEYDELLMKLAERHGFKSALRCYVLCFEAVASLKKLVGQIEDPCDYDDKVSVRISTDPGHIEDFEAEARLRNKHGLKVEVVDESSLAKRFGIAAPVGLVCGNAAQIDPLKFTRSLLMAAERHGLRAFERTRITTYEAKTAGILLKTADGPTIRAKHVVFATGYESEKYLSHRFARITTDFCFVTPKLHPPGRLEKCHVVEHAENYFYASTFGDRVMIGAESERMFPPGERRAALHRKTRELVERVQCHFPLVELKAERTWAGSFAKSKDSLPYLGSSERYPRSIFVLGYGGNGIAGSAMLSSIVVDLIGNGRSADARLFRFDR
jgi:glycine/D-amino acid oxidase-like deaminating enzyme